ncbi:MAG: type I CRISPR-associated protein Cas7 [Candidatus Helarchaeota archaeon]
MTFMKTREILFVMDSRDSNPNGERETGIGGARIDPSTNRAIISDVCLKRILRDYFMITERDGDRVLLKQTFKYSENGRIPVKETLLEDLGIEESALRKMDANQLQKLIISVFIDHRLFGSIVFLNKKLFATTGAVQFENTLSLNIPQVISFAITSTMASEKGKGAGAIGKTSILNYAIFSIHGLIKEALSEKTGATEEDAEKLFDALWNAVNSTITRTKVQQSSRLIISLVMKDPRFQIPHFKDAIKLKQENVSCFQDCLFIMDNLMNLILKYKDQIEKIEYQEDLFISYVYKEEKFKSFKEILKKANIEIPVNLLINHTA